MLAHEVFIANYVHIYTYKLPIKAFQISGKGKTFKVTIVCVIIKEKSFLK